ncbi:MAG: sugar phosphate isomerase/epimerase [Saprospiraceae bacterium]|nr:sugar phosphate isomerase/epimerase [Saprospiraceae bacterium]
MKSNFRMCLNPGNIGASFDQATLLEMAIKYGYRAISPYPKELAEMETSTISELLAKMKANDITWGSTNLPIDFRNDEKKFREDMTGLVEVAEAISKVGGTRMNTWIMPTHDLYTYNENFKLHRNRLKEAANVIGHYGIRLGLEYVGPKTLMARSKYSFIRTMAEAKELISAMGEPNVGFVLDTFHWYCAGETKTDILTLDKSDIVTVDLNDARTGFTVDEQTDGKRELPLATGVIPIKEFMEGIAQIGYDGPIRAEPFNQPLRDMEDELAVETTYKAMKKAFDLINQ